MGISEDERKLFETWLKEANVDLGIITKESGIFMMKVSSSIIHI